MNYYQELTILPDPDIAPYFIWSKLYTQLHIALADISNHHDISSIGVGFPNYRFEEKDGKTFTTLGNKLRVFAPNREALEALCLAKWLERLTDYVHIKNISEIGDKATEHVVVKRYRYKNMQQIVRNFAKHKSISFDEALAHCQKHKRINQNYPFINLTSESTKQGFKLSIIQTPVKTASNGSFNVYGINGMNGSATVPHW